MNWYDALILAAMVATGVAAATWLIIVGRDAYKMRTDPEYRQKRFDEEFKKWRDRQNRA